MRVFLTGGAGFVGTHVAAALGARGHEVHALTGDLLVRASYHDALAAFRPEACVHLAWYADPRDYLSSRANVDLAFASARLTTELVELGCRRIVAAGTCFEYDTSLGFLSETSALRPRHLYATCKRALFDMMTHLVHGSATTLAWTRLFWLYGPHEQRGRLVPAVADALLAGEEARASTGAQIRDFLHVADAAAAIVQVLEDAAIVGPINVASGKPVTVREVVETIARHVPGTPKIAWGAIAPRPDDPPFVCADVRKLAATGWTPRFDLDAGIQETVRWRAQLARKS